MKKLWLLNHYTGAPALGLGFRPYYLAQALKPHGIEVFPIGAAYHHCLLNPVIQKTLLRKENLDGIEYVWVKTPSYKNNGLRRVLNMFCYAWRVWRHHKKIEKLIGKPDVILVSSSHPLHIVFAHKMAKKYHAKLIFEVRDLWPLSLIEILKVSKFHPFVILLAWLERYAYKKASAVVSLLPYAKPYMMKHGLGENKFFYIPNGIDIKEFQHQTELSSTMKNKLENLKKNNKFIVMYIGSHGPPNALENMLYAADCLNRRGGQAIHFISVGRGVERELLMEKAKALNLSNITFFASIPKSQVQTALAYAHVAFIAFKNTPIYQYGISCNKLFDYMLAKKYILLVGHFLRSPVLEAGAGKHVSGDDCELLADEIIQLKNADPQCLLEAGNCGYNYLQKNHSYDVLAKEYVAVIDKLS